MEKLKLRTCQMEWGVTLVVSLSHISTCQKHLVLTAISITNSWVSYVTNTPARINIVVYKFNYVH